MAGWYYFIDDNPVYLAILYFFATYPIFSSLVWVTTSIIYYLHREKGEDGKFYEIEERPMVSVLIPAYFEERCIAATIRHALDLDYPNFEVIVIDDGSRDGTWREIKPFLSDPRILVIRKQRNEGKAMAINDAMPLTHGEIILVIDSDARVHPDFLWYIVPHFVRLARVAAITGNPRVANTGPMIAKIQAVEFSSIIAILRRAQTVWGRILTVSGVVSAFRRSALLDVGLFDPDMATEDIAMSWKLQKRFYDVRYEPRAVADMDVPQNVSGLWRQRRRWARGLAQVLYRNIDVWTDYRYRRLWPVYAEAVLSIFWAYCLVVLTTFWVVSYSFGFEPLGAHPIPNWWGMLIATFSIIQLMTGVWLAHPYDQQIRNLSPWAVFYPLAYWAFMSVTTAISTPIGLLRRSKEPTRWRSARS